MLEPCIVSSDAQTVLYSKGACPYYVNTIWGIWTTPSRKHDFELLSTFNDNICAILTDRKDEPDPPHPPACLRNMDMVPNLLVPAGSSLPSFLLRERQCHQRTPNIVSHWCLLATSSLPKCMRLWSSGPASIHSIAGPSFQLAFRNFYPLIQLWISRAIYFTPNSPLNQWVKNPEC